MDRKILTAEKILGGAEQLISHLENKKIIKIVTAP
jgi:hypothetical protein